MSFKKLGRWSLGVLLLFLVVGLLSISITDRVAAQATFGTNWSAQYYNNTNFSGNPVAQVAYPAGINFSFPGVPLQADNITPVPGVGPDNWSAIFTSVQNFPVTGDYQFFGIVDDLLSVTIDGIQVYNQPNAGRTEFSFIRTLTAGPHTIQLNYVEFAGDAVLQFQWQLGTTGPPVPEEPTGPFANVVTVRGLALRTGPYLGASLVAVLRPNVNYPILGASRDEGGPFTWYLVTAGERTGWASGRYLIVNPPGVEIPEMSNIFQEINDTPNIPGVTAVTRAVMNFRVRPSTRSPIIGQIPWGFELPLIGRTVQGGQNFWYHVRYGDIEGWIFADFVTVRGPIEAVPIR